MDYMTVDEMQSVAKWYFLIVIVLSMFLGGCVTLNECKQRGEFEYTRGYVDGLFFCSGIKKK